jgi:hypothetical protein
LSESGIMRVYKAKYGPVPSALESQA